MTSVEAGGGGGGTAAVVGGSCASPGCTVISTQRLACPKCIQLGIKPTYFCSQACFKANYATHKKVHVLAKQIMAAKRYDTHNTVWIFFSSDRFFSHSFLLFF